MKRKPWKDDVILRQMLFGQDEWMQAFLPLAYQVHRLDPQAVTIDCCAVPGWAQYADAPGMFTAELHQRLLDLKSFTDTDTSLGRMRRAQVDGLLTRFAVLFDMSSGVKPMSMGQEWLQIYNYPMPMQEYDVSSIHDDISMLIPMKYAGGTIQNEMARWRDALRAPALMHSTELFGAIIRQMVALTRERAVTVFGEEMNPPLGFMQMEFPLDPHFSGELTSWGDHAVYKIARHTKAPFIIAGQMHVVTHEWTHLMHAWNLFKVAVRKGQADGLIWLVYDPTLALFEGVAENMPGLLWTEQDEAEATVELYGRVGMKFDRHEIEAFIKASRLIQQELGFIRCNAALMMDQGEERDKISAYLIEKGLADPGRIPSFFRFVELLRSYIFVYDQSRRIYKEWLDKQTNAADAMELLLQDITMIPQQIKLIG